MSTVRPPRGAPSGATCALYAMEVMVKYNRPVVVEPIHSPSTFEHHLRKTVTKIRSGEIGGNDPSPLYRAIRTSYATIRIIRHERLVAVGSVLQQVKVTFDDLRNNTFRDKAVFLTPNILYAKLSNMEGLALDVPSRIMDVVVNPSPEDILTYFDQANKNELPNASITFEQVSDAVMSFAIERANDYENILVDLKDANSFLLI